MRDISNFIGRAPKNIVEELGIFGCSWKLGDFSTYTCSGILLKGWMGQIYASS